ncbi:sugar isomerase domain-containing protein [Jiangella sp. DSM 45060]|uniref:sugar isomerase domain-containing protein n=1 Tax=Jiangella sp. DSM 45060 TaxID=1798224 RepID=UPI00087D144E|nr:sugar isomerase domain-containing protein [Jiangella sp. DSM 45060]SDS34105.1 Uncharacterized protein, contains SIS (Sugar ISomerase) phosphosugar binding domain [Jiangella sp. DSM 45060]
MSCTDTAMSDYFDALQALLRDLREQEWDALRRAADVCAEAVAARGVIHVFDTGHLLSHEMICRTGGLVAYTPLRIAGTVDNTNPHRGAAAPSGEEADRRLVEWALSGGTLRRGDVLVMSSVSGTSALVVELTLAAQALGVTVVAVTAVRHSSRLPSGHSSGRRLHEIADVVLDDHADYGDSMIEVAGLGKRINPASGVTGAVLMWALNAGVVERLLARGVVPSVYTSVHLPDGRRQLAEVEERYRVEGR